MATYKKVAGGTQAQVYVNGIRKAKTFPTKAEAKSWAVQTEHELSKHSDGVDISKTVLDAFRRYSDEVSEQKKGARWEIVRLKKFERDQIANILLSDLRREHFDNFIDRNLKLLKSSSINRELNLISNVMTMCRRWRWMNHNPMTDLARPKNPPGRDRRIYPDELEEISVVLNYTDDCEIVSARHLVGAALYFAIETAMRAGEICALQEYREFRGRRYKCIDLEKRVVKVLDPKNGESRDVPLSTKAVQILERLKPWDGPVFRQESANLSKNFSNAVKKTAIQDLTFHDSRHEATTRLAKIYHVLDLARITGHKDINQLMVYYNETAEELAKKLS